MNFEENNLSLKYIMHYYVQGVTENRVAFQERVKY